MASVLTHTVVAASAAAACLPARRRGRFVALSLLVSTLPDVDVAGMQLGIPYGAPLGHRGLTHSLAVAAALGWLAARLACPGTRPLSRAGALAWVYFAALTASHPLLDAMTDGGRGVALFAPFDHGRYFLPWRPLRVSPIGIRRFLGPRGLEVLATEVPLVWVPCLLAAALARARRSRPAAAARPR